MDKFIKLSQRNIKYKRLSFSKKNTKLYSLAKKYNRMALVIQLLQLI